MDKGIEFKDKESSFIADKMGIRNEEIMITKRKKFFFDLFVTQTERNRVKHRLGLTLRKQKK